MLEGQAGRRGRNVRVREGKFVTVRFARVVDGDDAEGVLLTEFEFAGRPGRRVGRERFGRGDPSAVDERFDDVIVVTAVRENVRPVQLNRFRFRVEGVGGKFRSFRRRDRAEGNVFPIGSAEIVDGANAVLVRSTVFEFGGVGFDVGGDGGDGFPFAAGDRTFDFVAGFKSDVRPHEERAGPIVFAAVRAEVRRFLRSDLRRFDRQFVVDEVFARFDVVNDDVVVARQEMGKRDLLDAGRRRIQRSEFSAVVVVNFEREASVVGVIVSDFDVVVGAAVGDHRELEVVLVARRPGFQVERQRADHTEPSRLGEFVVGFVLVVGFLRQGREGDFAPDDAVLVDGTDAVNVSGCVSEFAGFERRRVGGEFGDVFPSAAVD